MLQRLIKEETYSEIEIERSKSGYVLRYIKTSKENQESQERRVSMKRNG